ncbi:flagellar hook-associated protein FlgK [Proteiniclasticum sp.]|uniref:flagellar hook-associated protein FlgK n=1 Tax=Proteiniclasticum sp. TaxID=2053595 RepID=UPI00289C153B|nr:flagellar hook-associated protein FlgK [Proteiniclasticum sp.]
MSGLFGTFNVAVKGLNANQTALHTTSHNISNANTEGFSRQRVELKTDVPYNMAGVGQLGTGVKLQSVVRMVDEFVDYQIRKESSTLSQYTAQQDIMGQIEMIFNEPSKTGVNFAMGEMFNSWQELSKNPESLNAKSMVVQKSKNFVDTLNHMSSQAQELKGDVVTSVEKNIYDTNSIIDQLNTVNDQIFNISVKGHSPNDLMDSRDLLLKKLSDLTEIKETYDSYGRATITIDGQEVTGKGNDIKLSNISAITKNEDETYSIRVHVGGDMKNFKDISVSDIGDLKVGSPVFFKPDGADSGSITKADIQSGTIGGNLKAMDEVDARIKELDTFAKGSAQMFNEIHNYDEDGGTIDFFTFDQDQESALNMRVNENLLNDESLVATGNTLSSPVGDGSRALEIANLRNKKFDFNTMQPSPAGTTMEGAYSDIVIKVGIRGEHATNMVDNQNAVLAQLSNRRESVSGVSIDEEVTNLLKYQRSYEANSRVINTLNEMLDTLINRTGV